MILLENPTYKWPSKYKRAAGLLFFRTGVLMIKFLITLLCRIIYKEMNHMTLDQEIEQANWLNDLPFSKAMFYRMGNYNPHKDYAGAEGDWKSKYVPRKFFGVDINPCAFAHDYKYDKGGNKTARWNADADFLIHMFQRIDKSKSVWGTNNIRKSMAYATAFIYWKFVRNHGHEAFNYE